MIEGGMDQAKIPPLRNPACVERMQEKAGLLRSG